MGIGTDARLPASIAGWMDALLSTAIGLMTINQSKRTSTDEQQQ